jgi:Arc/MetJ-type ribon-helix-helix transcriptional regulator
MSGRKLTGAGKRDFRVTIRLDSETYRSLSEAVEQGIITNISEALREMIRQKIWEKRFSKEMQRDLTLNEVSDEDLRRMKKILFGDLGTSEERKLLMVDGFLEGMLAAVGGIAKKALVELEKRHVDKVTRVKQAVRARGK